MSMGSDLVPPRISCYKGLIPCEIRVANCSDLRGLVRHYKILHSIPENYACQVAKAHLGADRQNVCCTWVAVHRPKILSAITAYRFGSLGLISWLATCPSARRQGIGSSLILHALNYLRDGGVNRIELHAVSEATRLYQEVGFTKEYDVELWIHPGLTKMKSDWLASVNDLPQCNYLNCSSSNKMRPSKHEVPPTQAEM